MRPVRAWLLLPGARPEPGALRLGDPVTWEPPLGPPVPVTGRVRRVRRATARGERILFGPAYRVLELSDGTELAVLWTRAGAVRDAIGGTQ
ncbi:MAG TPA: hypothetical protein VFQ85_08855 [Mycobacteriales bacterium]|nr:hypothetical protein [Mycobacteriales bacterium]